MKMIFNYDVLSIEAKELSAKDITQPTWIDECHLLDCSNRDAFRVLDRDVVRLRVQIEPIYA